MNRATREAIAKVALGLANGDAGDFFVVQGEVADLAQHMKAGSSQGTQAPLSLDVAIDELWRRVEARNQSPTNDSFTITKANLESWSKYFELPNSTELDGYDSP